MTSEDTAKRSAQSSSPVTTRDVWVIAAPLMISNVSVPLLGIVDTAVVGQLPGAQNIGAVAVGALIINLIYWMFGFLRMGTGGFTAQAFGSKNHTEVRAIFGRAAIVAVSAGLLIVILQWPLMITALAIVQPSEDVRELAYSYITIRIWGAPAVLANFVVLGWLLGLQKTKSVLWLQVYMNGTNMLLDALFVLQFGWGVEGVAIATLIAEVSALGVGLWMVRSHSFRLSGAWDVGRIKDWARIRILMSLNRDLFIRTLCLEATFVAFTAVGARLGDDILAANAVLLLFLSFAAYALDGFADAANTLVGSALGAHSRTRFWQAVRLTTLWAAIFSVGFMIVFWIAGSAIVRLISVDPLVQETAGLYLGYVIVMPIIAIWSYELDGIFIGATRGPDIRNAMLIATTGYFGLVWWLVPQYGNDGLWIALLGLFVMRATTLAVRLPAINRLLATARQ